MGDWRPHVEHQLKVVETMCHNARVSVWALERGGAFHYVVGEASCVSAQLLKRLWLVYRAELSHGGIVTAGEIGLKALRRRHEVVGLLAAAGGLVDDDLSRPYIERLCERLANLVRQGPEHSQLPVAVPLPPEPRPGGPPAARVSRSTLLALLQEARWNVTRVSEWLGLSRQTLYTRMHFFGITRPARQRADGPPDSDT